MNETVQLAHHIAEHPSGKDGKKGCESVQLEGIYPNWTVRGREGNCARLLGTYPNWRIRGREGIVQLLGTYPNWGVRGKRGNCTVTGYLP